jgi:hypothetical protein
MIKKTGIKINKTMNTIQKLSDEPLPLDLELERLELDLDPLDPPPPLL